jgi:hypothetical protein
MAIEMNEEGYGPTRSGWAIGGTVFAGVMMLLVGVFHAIAGLTAILDDQFFVTIRHYSYSFDVTSWGWIHLIVGVVIGLGGAYVFSGATWARVVGMTLAALSAIANFMFVPYSPFWSLLIIALDVWIIWSLSRPVEKAA